MSHLIDVIRTELRRQANREGRLSVKLVATDKPDTLRVKGRLDLYELAKAIEHAHQGRSGG